MTESKKYHFFYSIKEPDQEQKTYKLEFEGALPQVLKNLKANFILPNHHFYNLTKKGFTEFKSGHNLIRFDFREVIDE